MKLLVVLLLCVTFVAAKKRYDSYSVLEVTPSNDFQLQMLHKLEMSPLNSLDFWKEPSVVGRPVHIMVGPDDEFQLKWTLELNGLQIETYIENVQENIDAFDEERAAKRQNDPDNFDYDYTTWNTYEDFMTEVDNLVAICNAAGYTCTSEVRGQSYEGRDMKIMTIDTGATETFWVDSLIHAREWLAGATTMRIFNKMLTEAGTDEDVRRVLESYNWVYLPVMNPDGYSFTWADDRLWRKSRNDNDGSACIGTDLNRNYDYLWNTLGSSDSPCSDTYHGSSAGSEPETALVQTLSAEFQPRVWLSFHTYGQYWLVPYGDCSDPPQIDDVTQVTEATCAAIENTFDTSWLCGNSCSSLYATGGTTADYAMGAANAYYAYTPELRGPGFNPPDTVIDPSVEEIWNGLVAKVDEIAAIEGRR